MNNPKSVAAINQGFHIVAEPRLGTTRLSLVGGPASPARLDQYYTERRVAAGLYEVFKGFFDPDVYQMVEPSAGTGSFSDLLSACRWAFDIDPKGARITKADFLELELDADREIAVIGNPPFGKNASTAVRFFNHAAKKARIIAFILPSSFRKASIIKRLNRNFHLVHDQTVEPNAFVFESETYDVPTVFQIWQRRDGQRAVRNVETSHPDFVFTTPNLADIVIQRVGANAGRVHHDRTASPSCHYFISLNVEVDVDVEGVMKNLEPQFRLAAANVAGHPSLAKSEIVALYRDHRLRAAATPTSSSMRRIDLTKLTVELLSAFVANNNVRSDDLPALIASTHAALSGNWARRQFRHHGFG